MSTKRHSLRRRIREPDDAVFWDLSLGPHHCSPAFKDDDDARRAAWIDYRDYVMTTLCRPGTRPAGWWDYESPRPRDRRIEECQQLYEMGVLKGDELAEVLVRWRAEWARSYEDGFFFTTAPSQFVEGVKARRLHYQWAGIPPSLIEQWDAERDRSLVSAAARGRAAPARGSRS